MQINRAACGNLLARSAGAAWLRRLTALAVEGFGHDPGQGGFACTAHPAKNQGVRHPAAQKGVAQSSDYMLLAHDLSKVLRPGFAGKDEVGQDVLWLRHQQVQDGAADFVWEESS